MRPGSTLPVSLQSQAGLASHNWMQSETMPLRFCEYTLFFFFSCIGTETDRVEIQTENNSGSVYIEQKFNLKGLLNKQNVFLEHVGLMLKSSGL